MFKIKTLIELFDLCQIENVIAGLKFLPEKIVFVGYDNVMTGKRKRDLEKFFAMRNMNIETDFRQVDRYDYAAIEKTLNSILDENEDCCFDLTGGRELVLAAMGHVSAQRNIPMFQFNVRTGNVINVKNCENLLSDNSLSITIQECVALNGGGVVYNRDDDFNWDMTDGFKKDVRTMWGICKKNCGLWNRQSNVFADFEKLGKIDENFKVSVNLAYMKEGRHDTFLSRRLIEQLIKHRLISDYELEGDKLTFKYKNAQVHQCLSKAGNILELYTYMCANEIEQKDPGFYDDIDIGIYLDWDGIVHSEDAPVRDTVNEVDVLLVRDLVPVFISCKNGEVKKEALYELSTVAERLGGKYAKKLLVASYVSMDPDSRAYIKQRAVDMNIGIIENVDKMDEEKFIAELRRKTR